MSRPARKSPSFILRFFAALFRPPFAALPAAAWIYYVWCHLVYPQSPILVGNLPDTDDYMYLAQIADWLQGQGWFDNIQHRLNPPAGVPIHFSRLAELPMAGLWLMLKPFAGVSAPVLMAAIWPPMLLAVFLYVLYWTGKSFMSGDWVRVTSFIVLFATYLLYQFSPGHIDHHNLTALLVAVAFGFTARMLAEPDNWRWPAGAGFFLAFALVVGLEILPWLIVMTAWIGLWGMIKGRAPARSGLIYAAVLFAASAAFLAVTARPKDWLAIDLMNYSIVYVLLVFGVLVCFCGLWLGSLSRFAAVRYLAGIGLALAVGTAFLMHFPKLAGGPYGAMNRDLVRVMLDNIGEAKPIVRSDTEAIAAFLYLVWPVMGLLGAIAFWRQAKGSEKSWLWGMTVFMLAAAILLSAFYEIRFLVFAQLFTVIVMAAALEAGMKHIKRTVKGSALGLMQLGLVIVLAPLPMLVFPAAIDSRPFNSGILLFPVSFIDTGCDMHGATKFLNDPQGMGARPHLLMNDMNSGAELLFRTPHRVLGAPFHTNIGGNLDSEGFFTAANPEEAQNIARRRRADLVVLCGSDLVPYKEDSLAAKLRANKIPSWLEPIHYPGADSILLFRIKPEG